MGNFNIIYGVDFLTDRRKVHNVSYEFAKNMAKSLYPFHAYGYAIVYNDDFSVWETVFDKKI